MAALLYLLIDYQMSKLINQRELSRVLSGSDNSVRLNKVPKKYQAKVTALLQAIEAWEEWVKES